MQTKTMFHKHINFTDCSQKKMPLSARLLKTKFH